jgi:hypothetical protein
MRIKGALAEEIRLTPSPSFSVLLDTDALAISKMWIMIGVFLSFELFRGLFIFTKKGEYEYVYAKLQ